MVEWNQCTVPTADQLILRVTVTPVGFIFFVLAESIWLAFAYFFCEFQGRTCKALVTVSSKWPERTFFKIFCGILKPCIEVFLHIEVNVS